MLSAFRKLLVMLLASLVALAVNPQSAAAQTPTVAINGALPPTLVDVAPGQTVTVNVSNGTGHVWDWVALSAVGATDQSYLDWWWLTGTKTYGSSGVTSATFDITLPQSPGQYELRFWDYYWNRLSTSGVISIGAPGTSIRANGLTAPGVLHASAGATLNVQVSNGTGHVWDWVALSPVGAPNQTYVDWWWLTGTKTYGSSGVSSANFNVSLPQTPGIYELRFWDYYWNRLATSGAISVTQGTSCGVTMTPDTASFAIAGGSGTFTVDTTTSCEWSATSTAAWLTVQNGGSHTGAGTVSYSVAPNPAGARTAVVIAGNRHLTVTQAQNCQFTVTADGGSIPAVGATRTASITANNSTCVWTATSSAPWVVMSPASGSGNGSVQFTVLANDSPARTASVSIAGQSIILSQSVIPTELVVNGDFEQGSHYVADQYGTGYVGGGWVHTANSSQEMLLHLQGPAYDFEQEIEFGGVNDGILQWVSVPPNRTYVLTADVYVESGGAKIYMHAWGGGDPVNPVETLSQRAGAQRLKLLFTQPFAYGPINALVAVLTSQPGSLIRIDRVSLRSLEDFQASARITNGTFDAGFHAIPAGDPNGSGQLADYWTHLGQSTPPQAVFGGDGGANPHQRIDGGSFGSGLQQVVGLQANQRYLLRASVKLESGIVKLAIGPQGGVEVRQLYLCGGGEWKALSLIYTPQSSGYHVVTTKSLSDSSHFAVDDFSLMPTDLAQVYSAGTEQPCTQMATLTFEVHDSVTQQPVPEATVEIMPNYGNATRFTYPDGTISYLVGDYAIQFTVTKSGYVTNTGFIGSSGAGTHAVSLVPHSSTGASGGSGDSGGSAGGGTTGCEFWFNVRADSPTVAYLDVVTGPNCPWSAAIDPTIVSLAPSSGVGPGVITIGIPEGMSTEQSQQIRIDIAGYIVTLTSEVTSSPQGLFGWCVDSTNWLCRIIVVIVPPGGSFFDDSQGGGPPALGGQSTITRGGEITVGIRNGNGAQVSGWNFVAAPDGQTMTRTSNTGSRLWIGHMVTSGTISVTARWNGKDYPLQQRITVTPRPGWRSTPVTSMKRSNGYVTDRFDLTVTTPWPDSIRGAGLAQLDLLGTLGNAEVARVEDDGPNRHQWYVTSMNNDAATFDWSVHQDIEDPTSVFWGKQYGTWYGPGVTCQGGTGGNDGFISPENWRDGVRRHEGGTQNSHWSKYADAIGDPTMNMKSGMESFVSWNDRTKDEHLSEARAELERRRAAISAAYAIQPCGGECTPDCLFWNGKVNKPPYQ